jgi:large subunit ribosomal protein L15
MKYNELQVTANRQARRVGRGIAAGQGKTAGRGTKGQGARTGSTAKPGFEGGQNPLMQRLPKLRGFRSHRAKSENVYTDQLEQFANKVVNAETLAAAGLISNAYVRVKVLKRGDMTKKVTVNVFAVSQAALDTIEQAGGSFEKTDRLGRPASAKKAQKSQSSTKQG